MNRAAILFIFLFASPLVYARPGHLTAEEVHRVREFKGLLAGVDGKTLQQTVDELEKTAHPQVNLQIREAMALAYADIARRQNVEGNSKRAWLYSMVALNMAYLQFGGSHSADPLNALICRKLKEYLPANILKQPGFRYSLE